MDLDIDMVVGVGRDMDIHGDDHQPCNCNGHGHQNGQVHGHRRCHANVHQVPDSPNSNLIGFKSVSNLVKKLHKIDSKIVQHGAKMGFRTVC